ncbi:MAG TPA: electron transfer flavoprotein subunit alpha/FixB family protein [Anaerolineales bacterium]|nr:electron transfer flavoprotein subunit alpha/FixB family protein [Anaerolineales bacterium]
MANKIWAFVDQFQGQAVPASWEVVFAGRKLADQMGSGLTVLVIGSGVEALAQTAIEYGADEVLLADDPTLADYRADAYAGVVAKAAGDGQPDALLFPTTTRGREMAGMAAIDLNSGVLVDVTEINLEGDQLTAIRPVYAGKLLSKVVCHAKPQIITLRQRAFDKPEADAGRSGTVTKIEAVMAEDEIKTKVVGYEKAEAGVSLTDAGVIVSGGRGTSNRDLDVPADITDDTEIEIWKAQQGFKLIGGLANALGGAVGASRAAVDAGYIPYSHQVGQTGKVVSPDLYIACGISGAIQHLAGMRSSKVIVAINKDPDAPIFKYARFGVVGDLYDIVPALTEAMKERLDG